MYTQQSALRMSLQLVYYVYIQWFIFQIKLSGLSSFTHIPLLCMRAMPPDTDCWVPPGASTARSSWQGHPWLQTSVTEKMLQILCFPLLRNKLLTVNIHLRNPESWHFCGVTVGWSSVPIEKSQRGGQTCPHSSCGCWTNKIKS